MAKCIVCSKEINSDELKLTNDNEKCILHCEKDHWYTLEKSNFKKWNNKYVYLFYIYLYNYINSEKTHFFEKVVFPIIQTSKALNESDILDNSKLQRLSPFLYLRDTDETVRFEKCKFTGNVQVKDTDFNNKVEFIDCVFLDKVTFRNCKFNKLITFDDSTFIRRLLFKVTEFNDIFDFAGVKYDNIIKFNLVEFKSLIRFFANNKQYGKCYFHSCTFDTKSDLKIECAKFKTMDFLSIINKSDGFYFSDVTIEDKFILTNVNMNKTKFYSFKADKAIFDFHNVSFLDSKFIQFKYGKLDTDKFVRKNVNGTDRNNRELFSQLKYVFENQGDIITSNKFYSLEMKEEEKKLEKDKKKNLLEWLVFKIHGLSSNHSQDWILALFWIFTITFGIETFGYIESIYYPFAIMLPLILIVFMFEFKHNKRVFNSLLVVSGVIFYLLYGYINDDYSLCYFSNTLNPFSIMNSKDPLKFGGLIYKVTIAYLIYQFIVSIRQNTRRK